MNNYPIEDILPHKAPMILIDSLIEYETNTACCQVNITTQSPFYETKQQGVPSYIGCEYMAQSIAAFAGAQALDNNDTVSIGFLLGSRKYKTFVPYFPLGKTLQITIKELYAEDSGLRVYECEIADTDTNLLAQANINVFQPNDPEAFIEQSA
jgi:predicted hotdog family 3-hydroxylacyl-ACP dehydratase